MPSNNDIKNLITILETTTSKCEKMTSLNESIDSISKTINGLTNTLYRIAGLQSDKYERHGTIELIQKVQSIKITDAYRIQTYKNIHNDVKYDIRAGVMMDYILDKIEYASNNPDYDFDPQKVNQEAIAYGFKKLTGVSKKSMTLSEFKYEYRLHALGSNKKVLIYPNVFKLTNLCMRTPYILSFIDNRLIHGHIRSLNEYSKELSNKFKNIIEKRPKSEDRLNTYLNAFEMGIKNVLHMYKSIRMVFTELDAEYHNIFKQLISLDKQLKEVNESVEFINSTLMDVKHMNDIIIKSLNESTDGANLSLSDVKESFLIAHKEILHRCSDNINRDITQLIDLKNNRIILSKPIESNKLYSYSSLCIKNMLSEFGILDIKNNENDILNEIENILNSETDKNSSLDLYPEKFKKCVEDINNITLTCTNLTNNLLKNKSDNEDVDTIVENVLEIIDFLEFGIEHIQKVFLLLSTTLTNATNLINYQDKLKIVFNNIKNVLGYVAVFKVIIDDIKILSNSTIESIENEIKEDNES